MTGDGKRNLGMAGLSREHLARTIVRWLKDPTERSWFKEYPEIDEFRRYVRFTSWLRSEATSVDSSLIEDKTLVSIIVRNWLLNLGNWLLAYQIAVSILAEESLATSDRLLAAALEERARTGRPIGDIVRELSKDEF